MPKLAVSFVSSVILISGEPMTGKDVAQSDRVAWLRHLAIIAIVPAIIMVGLLWRSPNFNSTDQNSEAVLNYPLGGDFLQEYVGGRLILDERNSRQLYDAETFNQVQHDPDEVGFSWDPQQFFPAVYPPYWYAAVSPLSKLSYARSIRVWLVLMTAALIAACWLLNRYTKIPASILIVMCLSAPVIQSLNGGQKGTLLLLILTSSYVLLRNQRDLLSGLVFALIAFKPHLAIVIGLWMLVSRNWRWCVGAISGVAVLLIASFVSSPELMNGYVNVVLGFGDYVQSGGYNLHESFSLWSFWQLLLGNPTAAKTLTAISSMSLLGASLWYLRKETNQSQTDQSVSSAEFDRSFAAMVIVTILSSPHLYTYDLTMLLLPIRPADTNRSGSDASRRRFDSKAKRVLGVDASRPNGAVDVCQRCDYGFRVGVGISSGRGFAADHMDRDHATLVRGDTMCFVTASRRLIVFRRKPVFNAKATSHKPIAPSSVGRLPNQVKS